MDRRELFRRLVAAGAAPAWPALWPALARADADRQQSGWQADFLSSGSRWKIGVATPSGDLPWVRAAVRGRFPDAVAGTLLRIGPAGHDLGGERYHHWFDGDGMVQRLVIEGGQVRHQGRYVATDKRTAEVAAGKRLREAFGSVPPGVDPPPSPDSMNVANTSLLPLQGELLALWEGGSATRLESGSLDTLGPQTWRADLAGLPFSAHPKVDADGTVWNFGIGSARGLLVLYRIGADGALQHADALPVADLPMVHDFAITPEHLVFLLPPLIYDTARKKAGASFLDAHVWQPSLGMRVLVIDKKDWSRRQSFELPPGFLFHIGNAWEEQDAAGRRIHVAYVHAEDASTLFGTARELMRGRRADGARSRLALVTLDLQGGRASRHILEHDAEFPRIDARRTGLRQRAVIHVTQRSREHPLFSAIAATDVMSGRSDRHSYGPQVIAEEHLFVPDRRGPGWILGTALDVAQGRTLLSCFAADALHAGPVAQATLPRALPLGFHGVFMPA